MSSFSCPHITQYECARLKTDCVPGRAGCVLRGKVHFLIPAEERVRQLEEEKREGKARGKGAFSDERPLQG